MLGNTSEAIHVAVNLRVVEANDAFARLFGYESREEVVGLPYSALATPNSVDTAQKRLYERLSGGRPATTEVFKGIRKNGEEFLFESIAVSYPGDPSITISLLRDVTARERYLDALRESEQLYRVLAEAIPAGILIEEKTGRVIYANEQMARMSGYTVDELKRGVRLHDPDDEAPRTEYPKALSEGTSGDDFRFQLVRKDGERIWASVSWRPIRSGSGEHQGIVTTFVDVTERVEAEQALREREAALRAFMNALPYAAALVEPDGRCAVGNEALARRFGMTVEQLVGADLFSRLPQDIAALRLKRLREALQTGKPLEFEDERGGEYFAHHLSPVFDEAGRAVRVAWIAFNITDRKRAENALRESEAHYRSLVENLPGAVMRMVYDGGWRFDYLSDEIETITGYPASYFVGRPGSAYTDLIHPEDRDWVRQEPLAQMHEGRPFIVQYRLTHRDGSTRVVRGRGRGIRDDSGSLRFIDSVVFDVTDRYQAEQALRESEERFRSIVENTQDIIMLTGADGRINYINPAVEKVLGYAPGELTELTLDVIHPDDREAVAQAIREGLAGIGRSGFEHRLISKSGETVWVSHSWSPIMRDGKVQTVVSVVRDITERRLAEEKLREAHASLEKAYQIQREFLNNVTHEIRTPMTAVKGYVEMLLEGIGGPINEAQEIMLRKVLSGSESLLQLVTGLLEVARLQAGRATLRPTACKPGAVAEKAVSSVMPQAAKKGLSIDLHIVGTDQIGVYDQEKILVILSNILSNAVKFTPRGRIEVQVTSTRSGAEFIVVDSGIGIPQKDLATIFDEFRQVQRPGTSKTPGFGLGLSIVANMVTLLGGTVVVSSRPRVGTAFTLAIPTLQADRT